MLQGVKKIYTQIMQKIHAKKVQKACKKGKSTLHKKSGNL